MDRVTFITQKGASPAEDLVTENDGRSFMQSTVDPATGAVTEPAYSSSNASSTSTSPGDLWRSLS